MLSHSLLLFSGPPIFILFEIDYSSDVDIEHYVIIGCATFYLGVSILSFKHIHISEMC